MKFFDKKDASLANEVKRVITVRILVSLVILFCGIFVLGALNISSSFALLKRNVQSQCAILSEFTVSQLLINNERAVQLNLDNINASNRAVHFSWVKTKKVPNQNTISWVFPISWTEYCPIRSQDNDNFGYFKATGSLFYNEDLVSEILVKIGLAINFSLVIFLLLYPLGRRIPEQLFIRPVMDLLNLLKSGSKNQPETDDSQIAVEILEIKQKLIQMLNEAEKHSREVAFGQIAAKVAHDIRSPLAALNMLLKKNEASLPEAERNIIQSAAQRINDIANNLLTQKKEVEKNVVSEHAENIKPELVAILAENIISEKRAQYSEKNIQFELNIDENVYGLFLNVNADDLSRALSNLINNSVEAISSKGVVSLSLRKANQNVHFTLTDTGMGMHSEQLSEVLKKGISLGKKDGSGIGLSSAIQFIESWNGHFSMKSEWQKGTQVDFNLPIAAHPSWFVPVLVLQEEKTLVFLDDDEVIHQLWKKRLSQIQLVKPFHCVHLYRTDELIRWYQDNPTERKNAFFFIDYELIGSALTGSEIIKKLHLENCSLMVTSRYEDENLKSELKKLKVIPKSFLVHIPIRVFCTHPDFIFIDDDNFLVDAWKTRAQLDGKEIVTFTTLDEVNGAINSFSKDTPLYIDSNLGASIKGEDLAKNLYEKGFKTIYLCTGMDETEFPKMPWIKKIMGKEYPENIGD